MVKKTLIRLSNNHLKPENKSLKKNSNRQQSILVNV